MTLPILTVTLILVLLAVVCCLAISLLDSKDLVSSLQRDLSRESRRYAGVVKDYTKAVERYESLKKALRDVGDTTA